MSVNGYTQYQENQLLTASPGKLLLAAYDGAIRFCHIGLEKMKEDKLDEQSQNINKAIAIVCELVTTLHEDASPSLVARLRSIYIYLIEKLGMANIYQNEADLMEAVQILTDLRQTWAEADRAVQEQSVMEVAA